MDFCRQRPLAVGSCLFAIGLWAGFQGALTVPVWAGLLLFSLLIALLFRKQSGRVLYAVLACAFFAGGVYMAALESVPQIPDGMYDVSGYVTGSVSVREEDGYTQTYIKKAVLWDESGRTFRAGKMYWVMTAEDEDLALVRAMQDGDRVRFRGKVQTPLGRMNPYGYDFRLYLLQRGVRYRVSGMADLAAGADSQLSSVTQLLLGDTDSAGHLAAVGVDHLDVLLGNGKPRRFCAVLHAVQSGSSG